MTKQRQLLLSIFLLFGLSGAIYAETYETYEPLGAILKADHDEHLRGAQQGDAEAQYSLAFDYQYGIGVPENDIQAIHWYRLAAEQGHASAQFRLGLMYEHGEGTLENDTKAVKWYRLAAEQGHASAQFRLGMMYNNGFGVPENDIEAVKWFRLAAEQGLTGALSHLGVMYANGEGVPQDYIKAYVWVSLAKAHGWEEAEKAVEIIKSRMTPEQIAKGQEIAARCFESNYKNCD